MRTLRVFGISSLLVPVFRTSPTIEVKKSRDPSKGSRLESKHSPSQVSEKDDRSISPAGVAGARKPLELKKNPANDPHTPRGNFPGVLSEPLESHHTNVHNLSQRRQ
jgi:hypothetical protein